MDLLALVVGKNTYVNVFVTQLVFNTKPWWLSGKEPACQAGDTSFIPGSGRFPGEKNVNTLQYSCLENPIDRGARGLQSLWSQRVRHNLATKQQQVTRNLFPFPPFLALVCPMVYHGGLANTIFLLAIFCNMTYALITSSFTLPCLCDFAPTTG